jgi:hypothetical protein
VAHDTGDGDSEVNGLLANAESWDPSQTELVLILLCAGGIIAVGAMAGLVIIAIKRRQHPHTQPIFTAVMFWGLITLGSIVYATITQLNWDKQYFLQLLSGYGDPNDVGPALPWITWTLLIATYFGLVLWTFANISPREIKPGHSEAGKNGNGQSNKRAHESQPVQYPSDRLDRPK